MWRTLQRVLGICAALVLATFSVATNASADQSNRGKGVIKVLTYNVYEGTDFEEVLGAQTFPEFLEGVQLALNNVKATNPPLRMRAIAHQIAITQPDLVGLEEVTTWRVGPGPNPSAVAFDMLQELLDALAAQGQHYVPVVVVHGFDIQAPLPDLTTFVEATDSDVILARSDENLHLSNTQTAPFSTQLTVPTFVGPVTIVEGWAAVDVTFREQSLRFVITHLQPFAPQAPVTLQIQEAQAAELVLGPANTALPVIIAGDFNADASHPLDPTFATYQEMISFGFDDSWAATHPNELGFTCCQLADLSNMVSTLSQRIDFIFFRGQIRPLSSRLAAAETHERIDGLWPSDHAGVRATLLAGVH